ncbi:hypothetical protein NBE98_07685 [Clostridium swellfunianum]|uniref:hypothetical protein n=1 Tax=Clostridium swellfunianum TaxID=1367462 RepID=UPI00202F7FA5|nr:hypothetical protein [Clostridium swellfunianum]MCM0648252.1 hypothetical protein [Clostridium swellfunianum]
MNKLLGFFELKDSGLPAVPWKQFDEATMLDDKYLWTVRMAVYEGNDFSLPRVVGKRAEEALEAAKDFFNKYRYNGMVVYYPYFIAEKSGTLQVNASDIVVEAVEKDLWNLVTHNRKNVTIINDGNDLKIFGDEKFLKEYELNELYLYAGKIRRIFKRYITEGKTLLLEWSYAYKTDVNNSPIGEKYLVFYEIKEI